MCGDLDLPSLERACPHRAAGPEAVCGRRSSRGDRRQEWGSERWPARASGIGVPFLQLAEWQQPRAGGVVLVDVAAEAALQSGAVLPFAPGFDFVAFEAQGLELQDLSLVGLAHRNDVVQLAGPRSDGCAAELCTSGSVLQAEPLGGC